MTDYHILNVSLELCTRIIGHCQRFLHQPEISVEEFGGGRAEVRLWLPTERDTGIGRPKARIEIMITQVELEKPSLVIQIFGVLKADERENQQFTEAATAESIMERYADLDPIITESVSHRLGEPKLKEAGRIAHRQLEVKFKAFDKMYEADSDFMYSYNIDDIAEHVVPYIQALVDVHSAIIESTASGGLTA
jgi:hypothetical protein